MMLPPLIRQPLMLAYLTAAFTSLNTVQTTFYSYFEEVKYSLIFNGQVIMLEHLLNDTFDPEDRQIYIDDATQNPNVYVFNVSEENEDLFLFNTSEAADPLYLMNQSEYETDVDFIVYVPTGLSYDPILMNFLINKYRCAGKRFEIVEI